MRDGGVKRSGNVIHIWMSQLSQIDEFPHDYVPTVFDTHVADIEVDKKQVNKGINRKYQLGSES